MCARPFFCLLVQGRPGSSISNATVLEKWLAFVLTVAVLAILGLAIYIGIDRASHNSKNNKAAAVNACSTPDCVAFAGEVAASLNTSVNPCENFYEYACGGFVATHIRPDDVGRLSSFSALHDKNKQRVREVLSSTPVSDVTAVGKASQMYKTCLDRSTAAALGNSPLLNYIASVGGLPVASPSSYDAASWDFNTVLQTVQLSAFRSGFVAVSVSLDQKDTSQYLLHVSPIHWAIHSILREQCIDYALVLRKSLCMFCEVHTQ